tara:strand:- start:1200 stop:1460 length:261 start_codon:yes stop_codon:yes gene_type:complete
MPGDTSESFLNISLEQLHSSLDSSIAELAVAIKAKDDKWVKNTEEVISSLQNSITINEANLAIIASGGTIPPPTVFFGSGLTQSGY